MPAPLPGQAPMAGMFKCRLHILYFVFTLSKKCMIITAPMPSVSASMAPAPQISRQNVTNAKAQFNV